MTRKNVSNYIDIVYNFTKEIVSGKPCVFFDLETTGLNANLDRVLSCSAIKVVYEDKKFKVVDTLDFFMNPGFTINPYVTKINGITNEMVRNAPDEDEGCEVIREFFGDDPIVAGYNSVRFDQRFMENMYLRATGETFAPKIHLDVMTMVKEQLDLPNNKLITAAEELGCDAGLTFHKSIDDVYATFRIFKVLLNMYMVEECGEETITVTGMSYWAPRHTLARIYIFTKPDTKTYYDIYKKTWYSDKDNINMDDVRMQAMHLANVKEENELVRYAKKKKEKVREDAE